MSTLKNIILCFSSICRTKKIEDSSDPNNNPNNQNSVIDNEHSSSFEMKAKKEQSIKVNNLKV